MKSLLLQEIDKLRKGEFSQDLMQSIVNNEKKNMIQKYEKYTSRAESLMDEFTSEVDHKTQLEYIEEISKLTKKKISWILLPGILKTIITWQSTKEKVKIRTS